MFLFMLQLDYLNKQYDVRSFNYGQLMCKIRRWVDNIRMDLGEIGWVAVDWIGPAQDRDKCRALVNAVMNLRGP
jgi:hypothetical protein